jgi:shikimate dehydrogenase
MTSAIPYAEVIGDPIAHSKSPLIHGFWLGKLGLAGEYRRTRVSSDDLPAYLADRRTDPHWRGCNVTMPLKLSVAALADDASDDVRVSGAANCVLPRGRGRLEAYNFDVAGVWKPLSEAVPDHSATVQIVGAGGAARAAALGATRAGFSSFQFFARQSDKAALLADMLGMPEAGSRGLDELGPDGGGGPHVIINATPLGMAGQRQLPVDLDRYGADTVVFDMVYHPLETNLLAQARARDLRTIDGLQMLVAQAALAFEQFFGVASPREHDAELRALLTA